jgi:signal recognition particle receptor subunit beta
VPFINFPAREINCKLVYYGPGLGGKTANLQWIYDHTGQNQKGKMVLKGADGVVFVADSQEERLDANFETLENLQEHLKEHNLNFATIPYVLQFNKRDLPNVLSVAELTKQLQKKGEPIIEGVAIQGVGVFETLKELAKMVLAELKKGS